MAVVPDYKSGTASVTAGQRAVTGTGTAWQVSPNEPVVRPGDLFGRAGLWVPIESVTDNTHLTLAEDWSGATLTNSAYTIRFQPDGSRYTAAARTLVELLANGILANLAGVAGAAEKLPYMTGANTFGLADLTAFARSLLDDPNAAAVLATLGININGQSNSPVRIRNASNAVEWGHSNPAGFGSTLGAETNTGNPFLLFFGEQGTSPDTYRTRGKAGIGLRGRALDGGLDFIRAPAFTSDNQTATVIASLDSDGSFRQNGNKIVSRGSNANGEFVRFADGTQICWFKGPQVIAFNLAVGSLFRTNHLAWTYPAAFSAAPTFVQGSVVADSDVNKAQTWGSNQYTAGTTSAQIAFFSAASLASSSTTVMLHAQGRWF